jgi:hypothetical protein
MPRTYPLPRGRSVVARGGAHKILPHAQRGGGARVCEGGGGGACGAVWRLGDAQAPSVGEDADTSPAAAGEERGRA